MINDNNDINEEMINEVIILMMKIIMIMIMW